MNLDLIIHALEGAIILGSLVIALWWRLRPDSSSKEACSQLFHRLGFCGLFSRMVG